MATLFCWMQTFRRLAYQPPRQVDSRKKPFTPPGPWFDATLLALAVVLGIGSLL